MASGAFLKEEFRVLTPEAFEFVLDNELKRAVRSQNFLTLVLLDTRATDRRPDALREVTRIVSREVRETDLLSAGDEGRLSIVLLDADLQHSEKVIERLMSRLEHYQFTTPVDIEVGAACCPTHGADADTLRRAAEAQASDASRHHARGKASRQERR
jgi:GGDEF domain-containing protein